MASIDHQLALEHNLAAQNEAEQILHGHLYPFKPDIIFGHRGQKVLLQVVRASQTMRDIQKPDGQVQFRHRILEGLHAADGLVAKTVAIPITAVVSYDIENLKIEMKEGYDFMEDMHQQMGTSGTALDVSALSSFGALLTGQAAVHLATLKSPADKQRFDSFLKQLYKFFQIKQQTEKQYSSGMF